MTLLVIDDIPSVLLARRRVTEVPSAAFRLALSMIPAPPPFEDGLAMTDAIMSDPSTPRPVRIIWGSAQKFGRLYPEIVQYGPMLIGAIAPGVNDIDPILDAIFDLAKALDEKDYEAANAIGAQLAGLFP